MKDIDVLVKNKDIVSRVIDDEAILMPVCKKSEDINCIYTLNKAASYVWELIDGKLTVKQIKDRIAADFEVMPEDADEKIAVLVKELKEIKALQ